MLVLSEDLTLLLLTEWLQVSLVTLSRLDIAFCSRSTRRWWILVLQQLRLPEGTARQPMDRFLLWLHARRVHVEHLCVGVRVANGLQHVPLPGPLAFRTTSIRFNPCPFSSITFNIQAFLSWFPHLASLDWGGCHQLQDMHLLALPPLRRLILRNCKMLSPGAISDAVAAIGAGLEELHCEGANDLMLRRLAVSCAQMKKITFSSIHSLSSSAMVLFCSSNPQLHCIYMDGPAVTDALVQAALLTCPLLKELDIGMRSAVTYELLSFITNSAFINKLAFVHLSGTLIRFHPQGEGCEVTVRHRAALCGPSCCLSCLNIPIRELTLSQGDGAVIHRSDLRLLADLHGSALLVATLMLSADIERADVQYFLSHCPNMCKLFMSAVDEGRSLLSNDDLRNLPSWCPRITRIGLIDCAVDLTDDSVIYALSRWSCNHMTKVNFYGCRLLTDTILPYIEEYCPDLIELYLWHTGITKEALLGTMLCLSKNGVFHEVTAPDLQSKHWIADQQKKSKWKLRKVCLFQP